MLDVECKDLSFILIILAKLIKILHIAIPILLIILIIFDMSKVVIGTADEKAKSEALSKAAKRMIYAVLVFLVPTLLTFVFQKIDEHTTDDQYNSSSSWISCWISYYK